MVADAKDLLASWLDRPAPRFRVDAPLRAKSGARRVADLLVEQGPLRLVVEVKASGAAAPVGSMIEQAKGLASVAGGRSVPVVAVPYMGPTGRRLCAEAGVSWFDLSGNAHIVAPNLRILIEGKPNRFLRAGRPSSVFAPKSARVARRLLIEPRRAFRQQELARATGLDDGFVSRIVRRLEDDALVVRDERGAVRARDPDLLLDAWAEAYDWDKHGITKGHVAARSGEELLAKLGATFKRARLRHAATGLGAAWALTGFAGFRLATFFVDETPHRDWLQAIGFREEPRGANVWLVAPSDDGVFDGAEDVRGISCVHPVQAWLDLRTHPERAREAADELRARRLAWKR